MPEPIALRVKNVSKSFKLPYDKHSTLKSAVINPFKKRKGFSRQRVLKDISFEIKQGEFFGIVGRNGGGKSTLLKLLASIYAPEKGTIEVAGKLVPFIELGVGFNPELTGRDNVYLNGALLGFSDSEIDEIYDDIVEFAELEKFMDQKLKNYSSGMQVRLAFSVATRSKADILLVDEVLAVGDAAFQRKCYDYFSTLKKNKKTVVFISHDMNAIRQYCDRTMLIDDGEIKALGSSSQIAAEYTKLFIQNIHNVESEVNEDGKRWGENVGAIISVKAFVDPEQILIKASTAVPKNLAKPVIGFTVKNSTGFVVIGANTNTHALETSSVPGGVKKISWSFENILSDGEYSVDFAILDQDGLAVLEWWEDAVSFKVNKAVVSPYPVTPKIKFSVQEEK
jgi:ABC-2 type transport system ATP-binding protein